MEKVYGRDFRLVLNSKRLEYLHIYKQASGFQ